MWPLNNQNKILSNKEVLTIVEGEQKFASQFDPGISNPPSKLADKDKSLEQWLVFMQRYLNRAIDNATVNFQPDKALEDLRIVLSLGFNAAKYHGLPERQQFKAGFKKGTIDAYPDRY